MEIRERLAKLQGWLSGLGAEDKPMARTLFDEALEVAAGKFTSRPVLNDFIALMATVREKTGDADLPERALAESISSFKGDAAVLLIRAGADLEKRIDGRRPIDRLAEFPQDYVYEMNARLPDMGVERNYRRIFTNIAAVGPTLLPQHADGSAARLTEPENFDMYLSFMTGRDVDAATREAAWERALPFLHDMQAAKSGTLITDGLENMQRPTYHLLAAMDAARTTDGKQFQPSFVELYLTHQERNTTLDNARRAAEPKGTHESRESGRDDGPEDGSKIRWV